MVGKLKRVGIDRMRVEIGSSCSTTLFDAGEENLIYRLVSYIPKVRWTYWMNRIIGV